VLCVVGCVDNPPLEGCIQHGRPQGPPTSSRFQHQSVGRTAADSNQSAPALHLSNRWGVYLRSGWKAGAKRADPRGVFTPHSSRPRCGLSVPCKAAKAGDTVAPCHSQVAGWMLACILHTYTLHTRLEHTYLTHTYILHTRVLNTRVLHTRVLHTRILHTRVLHTRVLHTRVLHTRILYTRVSIKCIVRTSVLLTCILLTCVSLPS
jgi:hypothetical protein